MIMKRSVVMKVEIEKMDNEGRGITHIDGKVTFVNKTIPEDIVDIEITKNTKNYNEGIIKNIIKESPKRIEPFCPFYYLCGGCDLQNLNYEDTIKYKKETIINLFTRKGIIINPEVIKNSHPLNYRNKIELKVKNKKIGFYEQRTNRIVEINKCFIASEAINKAIELLPSFNIINGDIILRSNKNNEVLIIINSKDNLNLDIELIKKQIKLVGIVLNDKNYYGENYLFETINHHLYKISYNSFFQINPYIAEEMIKLVEGNISLNCNVLDLYCGVGALSLNAAKKASKVIGVEVIPNAILNAVLNSKINKITNTSFVLNDVSKVIDKIAGDIDTLIIDPPRSGIQKEVINKILEKNPQKIIYISCNPVTLLRDIELIKNNYTIEKFYIMDMFSYTKHIECMCIMNRK